MQQPFARGLVCGRLSRAARATHRDYVSWQGSRGVPRPNDSVFSHALGAL